MIAAFGREYFGQNEEKIAEVVERLYWCNGQKMRVFIRVFLKRHFEKE